MSEEKKKLVEDEPLVNDESKILDEAARKILEAVPSAVVPEEPEEDAEPQEPSVPEVETEPLFKNMPGPKVKDGPTVKDRVPGFKAAVLKLYKRMKYGESLTIEQFAKRLKLKTPDDIQAAGIAWHHLFDEGKVAVPQFYKPPRKD